MSYTVYVGSFGSEPIFQISKDDWLPRYYENLDDALDWTRQASAFGLFPLLIEGTDGTRLTTKEISALIRDRTPDQVGRTRRE